MSMDAVIFFAVFLLAIFIIVFYIWSHLLCGCCRPNKNNLANDIAIRREILIQQLLAEQQRRERLQAQMLANMHVPYNVESQPPTFGRAMKNSVPVFHSETSSISIELEELPPQYEECLKAELKMVADKLENTTKENEDKERF